MLRAVLMISSAQSGVVSPLRVVGANTTELLFNSIVCKTKGNLVSALTNCQLTDITQVTLLGLLWVMVWSRCLGQQSSKLQVRKSPSFLAAFHGGAPPFVRALRVSRVQWWRFQQKCLCPLRDLFSLYLYHVGHFKYSYALDNIATLFRSPMYALHGLALRAIQCQVVLFVFELVC